MFINKLYLAEVIDNDDSNHPVDTTKQSRVKISIFDHHDGTPQENLPWARPFDLETGSTSSSGKCKPPEIGSKLWVFYEKPDIYQNPFYIADASLKGNSIADKFDSTIKSKITGQEVSSWSSTYPDVKFTMYENGVTEAVSSNTTNPEILVYHPSGAFDYTDKDGKRLIQSPSNIYLESGSATVESMLLGETTKAKIEALIDELNSILTNITLLTVNTAVGPSTPPINAASFVTNQTNLTTLKAQLSQILSLQIKNN